MTEIKITAKPGCELPDDLADKVGEGLNKMEERGELEWTPVGWRVLPGGMKMNQLYTRIRTLEREQRKLVDWNIVLERALGDEKVAELHRKAK